VTIINRSKDQHDLSGWQLQSKVQIQAFTFPENTTIPAGSAVSVWAGAKNESRGNPPASFFWTKSYIWNNKGDAAVLKNAKGEVVDEKEVHPSATSPVNVRILGLELLDDYVTVINKEPKDVDVSGWFIKSVTGKQYFVFPNETTLKAGATTTVWSGKGADTRHHPPVSYSWTNKYIWNNKGDTAALYNAQGGLIDWKREIPEEIKQHEAPPKH